MATENVNIRINVDNSQAQKQTDNLKLKIKQLRDEMARLAAAGKENSDEYRRLAQEAGRLQDIVSDTAADIKNLAADNQTLAASLQGVSAGVAVFGALQSAAALLGVEDEKLLKTMQKIQAIQAILNSLNTIANALNKNSALMVALRTKSQSSLNKELAKTTVEEKAGTVSMGAYTAGEAAATTGAVTLKGAIKSVGAAMKSIPVVGWILAAIAAVTTLISLIKDANDEEERGLRLREQYNRELEETIGKSKRLNITTVFTVQNMEKYRDIVKDVSKKGTTEWLNAVDEIAKATGLSTEYIKEHANTVGKIVADYDDLTTATEQYNNQVQAYNQAEATRLEKEAAAAAARAKWEGDRKKYGDDAYLTTVKSKEAYDEAKREAEAAASTHVALGKQLDETRKRVENLNTVWKTAREDNDAFTKALEESASRTEHRTADAEREYQRFVQDSKKEIEELNNALYGQDEEEKLTEKYDRLLDLAIKYYGEESEEYAKVVELRAQSLEGLKEKQSKADEELAKQRLDDERKFEDERLQVAENGIKTEMTTLEEGSQEWYKKKIELDRLQEDREKQELERKLADNLISEELYLSEYDKITAEHAKTRAEIEMEFNKRVADDYREKMMERVGYAETFVNAFSNMVEAAMEAELEAVGDNEAQQKEVRKKYAKAKWLSDIAGIGVSTAKSIMEAWSSVAGLTPPLNLIMGGMLSAMIGAQGALQTAQATSAMTKALSYGRGGLIQGKSHNEGGVDINAEGNEMVINKRSTAAFLPLLSAINEAGGGVPVNTPALNGSGKGQIVSTVDKSALREIVAEVVGGVVSIPVTVLEKDITDSQTERRTIVSRGRI